MRIETFVCEELSVEKTVKKLFCVRDQSRDSGAFV